MTIFDLAGSYLLPTVTAFSYKCAAEIHTTGERKENKKPLSVSIVDTHFLSSFFIINRGAYQGLQLQVIIIIFIYIAAYKTVTKCFKIKTYNKTK